jgi:dihydropteroate synthase
MARVMGILNTTPDSFSDGGRWSERDRALRHALNMAAAGADIVDVGGESTRPGAQAVGLQEELDRVIPVIEAIVAESEIAISVDTSKPEVMRAAVSAGATMINDVMALREDGALAMAAELAVPVCLMHMQGRPRDMQQAPHYADVVAEVQAFLLRRADDCVAAGLAPESLYLDPGFGFGKTLAHNLELFRSLPRLCALGYPVLVGVSRKSMLGALTGKEVGERLAASLAAAVLAARSGAAVLRVHDVAETVDALKVAYALEAAAG